MGLAESDITNKIENLIYMPVMAIGQACSVFTGQNYGAGKYGRMVEGLRKISAAGIVLTGTLSAIVIALRAPLFRAFINDPEQ